MTQLVLKNFCETDRARLRHRVRQCVRDVILINAGGGGTVRELRRDDRLLRFAQNLPQHDRFKLAAGLGDFLLFSQAFIARQFFNWNVRGVHR